MFVLKIQISCFHVIWKYKQYWLNQLVGIWSHTLRIPSNEGVEDQQIVCKKTSYNNN